MQCGRFFVVRRGVNHAICCTIIFYFFDGSIRDVCRFTCGYNSQTIGVNAHHPSLQSWRPISSAQNETHPLPQLFGSSNQGCGSHTDRAERLTIIHECGETALKIELGNVRRVSIVSLVIGQWAVSYSRYKVRSREVCKEFTCEPHMHKIISWWWPGSLSDDLEDHSPHFQRNITILYAHSKENVGRQTTALK